MATVQSKDLATKNDELVQAKAEFTAKKKEKCAAFDNARRTRKKQPK
jgi:hypothetical protein